MEGGVSGTDVSSTAARQRLGPLVHRSVHHGAIVLVLAAAQWVLANIVTQIGYGSSYSISANYISDLGAAHCGYLSGHTANGGYVCSPWHLVFDVSTVLLGLLLILAVLLLRTAFRGQGARRLGLALLAISGIGAIGVGLSPEDVNITVHTLSALLAFAGGGLALVVLGFAMFRDTRWDGFRTYTIVSGLVGLIALVLFVAKVYAGLGVGGMERLIVAPVILWSIVAGIHLVRIPTYAPPGVTAAPR
jgi:hypothetical membrane protein